MDVYKSQWREPVIHLSRYSIACLQLSRVGSRFRFPRLVLPTEPWQENLWRAHGGRSLRSAQDGKEMYHKVGWRSGVFISHLSSHTEEQGSPQ